MPHESTTPAPEEAVRRSMAAAARHDFDGVLAAYRPDAVWDMSTTGVGVFEGRDAIRGFFEDWLAAYEQYEHLIEQFRDPGSGVTLGAYLRRGRPAGSRGFVALRYADVETWRDGLIERSTNHTDVDEARAAAERLAEERG
jgi:ketosteroid isomerase-like protein